VQEMSKLQNNAIFNFNKINNLRNSGSKLLIYKAKINCTFPQNRSRIYL